MPNVVDVFCGAGGRSTGLNSRVSRLWPRSIRTPWLARRIGSRTPTFPSSTKMSRKFPEKIFWTSQEAELIW